MFNLIPGNITHDVDLRSIISKVESLLIITSEKRDMKEKMNAEFKALVDKNKSYEELMRVRNGKSNVTFNVRKKGDLISELIMLVSDEKDFVAIQLLGNFTLDDIQKLTKDMNIQ